MRITGQNGRHAHPERGTSGKARARVVVTRPYLRAP